MRWTRGAMWAVAGATVSGFFLGGAVAVDGSIFGTSAAAWVQAVGSITAIIVAGFAVSIQLRAARAAEARARNAATLDKRAALESIWETAHALLINATAQLEPLIQAAELPGEIARWINDLDATIAPIAWAQERLATFPSFELGNGNALLAFIEVRTNLHFAELALRALEGAVTVDARLGEGVKSFLELKKTSCIEALDLIASEWNQVQARFEARLEPEG